MSRISLWVAEELAGDREPRQLMQVAPRIERKYSEMLDAIGDQLGRSRTAVAGILLEFAITEAANTMNLGWVPDDEGEEQVVLWGDKE